MIPEGRGVFPKLTVRENLAMFVQGRDVDRATEQAAEVFPILGQRLGQNAGTMSGGEQQMLAVARALVTDPLMVIADELSVGLAPRVIDQIFEAIDVLRRAGTSMMIVEQYVDRVLPISDYVYVMDRGRIALVDEASRCDEAKLVESYLGGAS